MCFRRDERALGNMQIRFLSYDTQFVRRILNVQIEDQSERPFSFLPRSLQIQSFDTELEP